MKNADIQDEPRRWLEPPSIDRVAVNLERVRGRITSSGRDPDEVKIVAVTKGFTPRAVVTALSIGLSDIGENYSKELRSKAAESSVSSCATSPCWQFLGRIQRRQVKSLAHIVDCWQTVSRVEEGEAIAHHAPAANVMVEVDVTGIPGRVGCPLKQTAQLVGSLRGLGLDVTGLMVVGPPGPPENSRLSFREIAGMASELGVTDLSMGMSGDLEVAVEEGATVVRVGRALFGERAPQVR